MSLSASTKRHPTRIVIAGLLSRRPINSGRPREGSEGGVYGWPTQEVGHDELVVGGPTITNYWNMSQAKEVL